MIRCGFGPKNISLQYIEQLKLILSRQPVLKFFDPAKSVKLQVDVSKSGLGACLLHDGHPISYASRSWSSAEVNYAQIEKGLVAVVFGFEKFYCYVYGNPIDVDSDHKPLVSISTKTLGTSLPPAPTTFAPSTTL